MKIMHIPDEMLTRAFPGGFSHRDEANALTAYAFRNGMLEDLHAGETSTLLDNPKLSRITNEEMKRLMIEASEKIVLLLTLRETDPEKYMQFVQAHGILYCNGWER
ncbi:MAG: hypothetical protein ABL902_02490 [Gallionella sp.]